MKLRTPIATLSLLWLCGMTMAASAAVSVYTDVGNANDYTLMLKNFNGAGAEHSSLGAGGTTPVLPVWGGNQNGYGRYSPQVGTDDPRVQFNTIARYDVNVYGYVRVRQRASVAGHGAEIWPNSAVGPTTVALGGVSTTFTETNRAWLNTGNASIVTATLGGFRWDPITSPNPATAVVDFDLDYVMVDRGRVRGFEFDVSEGLATDLQGWGLTQISGETTINGILSGTTTGIDAVVGQNALALDTSIFRSVEIRMRATAGSTQQIYWDDTAAYSEGQRINLATADGEWHRYVIDFSNETTWTGATLNGFRVDVANGASGNTFEIDYIRFREFLAAPEPTRSLLFLMGAMAMCLRRSRSQAV